MTDEGKTELIAIGKLKPHPANPRKGNVDAIVESIKVNGFYGSLVVQKSTMFILAGNHRWQAAKRVGMTTIPCMVIDVDDAQAKKILLADNRTSDFATYDNDELTKLLREVISEETLAGTGFDAHDLDKLLADVTDEPNAKRKRNLEPFHNCYWLVKAPISEQGRVSMILGEALNSIDGVDVASATN
jgi:ParB-like chromosome segregation protein Spo0J